MSGVWAELVKEIRAELSSPKASRPMMLVGGKDLRNILLMADEIARLKAENTRLNADMNAMVLKGELDD
jgi:uncharacterized small protein (DUF1192 family)